MKMITLTVLCLGLLTALPAFAECNAGTKNLSTADGLKDFFISCQRTPNDKEAYFYTFGHKDKFKRLLNDEYQKFSVYNQAQQYAYAGIMSRDLIPSLMGDTNKRTELIKYTKSILSISTVADLQSYYYDPVILINIQNKWRLINKGMVGRPKDLAIPLNADNSVDKLKLIDLAPEAYAAINALALDMVNPGFLDDLPFSVDKLIKTTKADLEKATGDLDKVRLEGRLLGLERSKTGKKRSNISYGPAVYLSTSMGKAIEYYYNEQHEGYVCTLPAKAMIVDFTSAKDQQTLIDKGVFLRAHSNQSVKARFPGDYNELANPFYFRAGMYNRMFNFGDTYADNGVINYKNACKPLVLNDFRTCHEVSSLLASPYFYGSSEKNGALYDFIVGNEPEENPKAAGKAISNFLNKIKSCAGDTQTSGVKSDSCTPLKSSLFLKSSFNTQNKVVFDEIRTRSCE